MSLWKSNHYSTYHSSASAVLSLWCSFSDTVSVTTRGVLTFGSTLFTLFILFAEQEDVFAKIGKGAVSNVLNGYNSTVFAYGQTGSGKTFTVTGGAERCAFSTGGFYVGPLISVAT